MGTEESSGGEQWYLLRNGKQHGPYIFSNLIEAVSKNDILKHDLVWRLGWKSWQQASAVPGLFLPPPPAQSTQHEAPRVSLPRLIRPPKADERISTDPTDQSTGSTQPDSASQNYFMRHWRGELSLPISYWVNNFVAAIPVLLLTAALTRFFESNENITGAAIAGSLSVFTAVLLGTTVWQTVGVWRSASRHTSRGGRVVWAVVAKVTMVIGTLSLLAELNNSFLPIISEEVQIALGDMQFGEHSFRLVRNGTELEFSGGINVGTANEFRRTLDGAPQVRVLHLNSTGGRLAEANSMAAEVRKRRLSTYVSDQCASACTDIFLAGRERWISEDGEVGFHQPSFPRLAKADLRAVIEQERRQLVSMGLPPDFVSKAVSTPTDSMWWPSHAELLKAGVISGVVDGARYAASGEFAPAAISDRYEKEILKIPFYATLKRVEPRAFERVTYQFDQDYGHGATEEDILSGARAVMTRIMRQYLLKASDAAVLESAEILLGYMGGLKDTDSESCVAVWDNSKGARLGSNLTKQFPAISSREIELSNSILESGARSTRAMPTEKQVEIYLLKVFDRLERRPEIKPELLDSDTLTRADYEPFCEAGVALLQEIRRLPSREAAEVLRYIYSLADQ